MMKYSNVIARILLAQIFVVAGVNKIIGYAGTQGYMEMMGIPGILLPLVIVLEIVGGLALIVGWNAKYAAYALAGFTVLSGLIFHNNLADQIQMIQFMKNLAIAGGLLLLAEQGAGAFSFDKKNK